jgi:hypothetical protein
MAPLSSDNRGLDDQSQPTPTPTADTGPDPSSNNSSPSMLPYLRDSSNPSSPQTDLSATGEEARVPAPKAGPSVSLLKLLHPNATLPYESPSTSSTSPTSTPLSAATSSTSSKTKKRPEPLILGKQEIGQDEELTAQLRTDGRWSARSGITIISPTRGKQSQAEVMAAE